MLVSGGFGGGHSRFAGGDGAQAVVAIGGADECGE